MAVTMANAMAPLRKPRAYPVSNSTAPRWRPAVNELHDRIRYLTRIRALDGAGKAGREVEPIILLEYSRHPESFRKALMEGLDLKSCRDALALARHSCELPGGAKMFVHPHQ